MNAIAPTRKIAIASGKGGVGKTWFAITLAHAMARTGERVLLLDADLGLANVDIQLGLPPGPDLAAVLAGRCLPAQAARATPHGFAVLAGASGCGSLAAAGPEPVEALLADLRGYDAILLDLGAGLDRANRRLAVAAEIMLLLANEEPTSITDAYAVLKLYRQDGGGEAAIVINQAASHAAGERTYAALAQACETFLHHRPKLAGVIRRDPRVPEAIRHQLPLLARHPLSHAAEDVEAIATRQLPVATKRVAGA